MVAGRHEVNDGSGMPTIQQLIRAELDAGKTVRQLADLSGGQVKFQTFQELSTTPPKQFPKDTKTIAGMSQALGCSESAIVLAYALSLGVAVTAESTFAFRLPAGVDELTPEMSNALLSVVRAAVKQIGTTQTAPVSPTPSGREAAADDTQTHRFTVLRYDPSQPESIGYGGIEATDYADARVQLHHSLTLSGHTIDQRSHGSITIANYGVSTTLIGILRSDADPEREDGLIEKLKARAAALDAEHQPSAVEEHLADVLAQQGVHVEHDEPARRSGIDIAVPFERSRVSVEGNEPSWAAAAAELLGSPLAFFSSDEFVERLRDTFTALRAADPSLDLSEEMDVQLRAADVQPDRDGARRGALLRVMKTFRERAVDVVVAAERRGVVEAAEQWLNAASHAMAGAGARQGHSPSSPDDGESGATAAEIDAAGRSGLPELEADSVDDDGQQAR